MYKAKISFVLYQSRISQFAHLQTLRGRPDLDYLRHLLLRVGQRADDEQPVQQVARNAMRGDCKSKEEYQSE